MSQVSTGPHEFRPLKRRRNKGRCLHCFIHEDGHPVERWSPARPYGDTAMPKPVITLNGPDPRSPEGLGLPRR